MKRGWLGLHKKSHLRPWPRTSVTSAPLNFQNPSHLISECFHLSYCIPALLKFPNHTLALHSVVCVYAHCQAAVLCWFFWVSFRLFVYSVLPLFCLGYSCFLPIGFTTKCQDSSACIVVYSKSTCTYVQLPRHSVTRLL